MDIAALKCNEPQREAICHGDGPALVIAGPGSGKTFVLTHRIAYLTENLGVPEDNILVITFTKASAVEMQERAVKLAGQSLRVVFGTFHSVFFNILRQAGLYSAASLIKDSEKYRLILELVEDAGIETKDVNETVQGIISDISRRKNRSSDIIPSTVSAEKFRYIYRNYKNRLENRHQLDFDDMLLKTYKYLCSDINALKIWQQKFRYILIDEFQDIDELQFETVKLLLGKDKNIFVVGDDDQSIYSFRGSRPEIMLGFENIFPDCKKIVLNVNYRSTSNIVDSSLKLISNNENRFEKQVDAFNGNGEEVEIIGFENREKQALYIMDYIKRYKGLKSEIAILSRTNGMASYLATRLQMAGIKVDMTEKPRDLYSHFIAQDLFSYLRLALGDMSRENFYKIMNRPLRYISRMSVDNKVDFNKLYKYYCTKNKQTAAEIKRLSDDMSFISKMKPAAALNYILKGIGYIDFLKSYALENRTSFDELMEICDEILEFSKGYDSLLSYLNGVKQRQEDLANAARYQNANEDLLNCVKIQTMHGSKGLEYEIVFIIDVAEGNIPYKKAVLPEEIEEERRLFYVAMTRAKKKLYICGVDMVHEKKVKESRFLEELTK